MDCTWGMLIDAAWEPVEEQMRVAGVTHDDIVTALGRHSGILTTALHKTIKGGWDERDET